MLLHHFLEQSANRFPDKVYLIHNDMAFDYRTINLWADRIARWLVKHGLKKGDRVLMLLDNSPEYVASYYGILKGGGVSVPINPDNVADEVYYLISECEAKAVIIGRNVLKWIEKALPPPPMAEFVIVTTKKYPQKLAENRYLETFEEIIGNDKLDDVTIQNDTKENELASLIYTSGTTGRPKGVMLSHHNLIANTNSIVEYLKLTENDRVMAVLPFFYSYGNSLLQTHTAVGGSLVLHNGFTFPNLIVEKMIKYRCSGFAGVPTTYALLMYRSTFRENSYPDLRYVTIAGGALPVATLKELAEIVKPAVVIPMYGQTEASARLSYLPPQYFYQKIGSIGIAIPGVTLKVLREDGTPVKPGGEIGEIVAQGENIMLGYWKQPEETQKVLRKEGLWTGDLAWIDEDGFIYIVARKKDIIKSGAYRISPGQIEEVLAEHPGVAEACVVGEPDDILGEAIVAFVVPKPDHSLDPKELATICRKKLPSYQVPKRFEIVEGLPKTTSGKIKKQELRDMLKARYEERKKKEGK